MAPRPPTTRPKPHSTRPSSLSNPHKPTKPPTKKLKRASKHATLLSRITKSAPRSKVLKRRRPSKKLVTNLEALADALPESTSTGTRGVGGAGEAGEGKIRHKSLKSRPGAGKRKEKVVAAEMERFGRNMARLCAGSGKGGDGEGKEASVVGAEGGQEGGAVEGSSKERWAAIRVFIAQTMERRVDGEGGVGA